MMHLQLGPAVRAMALQECDWQEDKAVVMLRRFQVGRQCLLGLQGCWPGLMHTH